MAETVIMPKLGFDMAEGTLVRWVKAEGEAVKKGDVLAEIETDKAPWKWNRSFDGVVHQHLVEQGSIVPVGTPIAVIAAPGEKVEKPACGRRSAQQGSSQGRLQPAAAVSTSCASACGDRGTGCDRPSESLSAGAKRWPLSRA